jgi:hypothetical protein
MLALLHRHAGSLGHAFGPYGGLTIRNIVDERTRTGYEVGHF